jgi:hypothetical protein
MSVIVLTSSLVLSSISTTKRSIIDRKKLWKMLVGIATINPNCAGISASAMPPATSLALTWSAGGNGFERMHQTGDAAEESEQRGDARDRRQPDEPAFQERHLDGAGGFDRFLDCFRTLVRLPQTGMHDRRDRPARLLADALGAGTPSRRTAVTTSVIRLRVLARAFISVKARSPTKINATSCAQQNRPHVDAAAREPVADAAVRHRRRCRHGRVGGVVGCAGAGVSSVSGFSCDSATCVVTPPSKHANSSRAMRRMDLFFMVLRRANRGRSPFPGWDTESLATFVRFRTRRPQPARDGPHSSSRRTP